MNAILNLLERVAERSSLTANRVADRLSPVATPELAETAPDGKVGEAMPPLLSKLHDGITIIQGAIDRIENTLDRLEL